MSFTFTKMKYDNTYDLLVKVTGILSKKQERTLYDKIKEESAHKYKKIQLAVITCETPLINEQLYEKRYYNKSPITYLYYNDNKASLNKIFPKEVNGFVNYIAIVLVFERNGILYTIRERDDHNALVHISAFDFDYLKEEVYKKTQIRLGSSRDQNFIKILGNIKMDSKNRLINYEINYDYLFYKLTDKEVIEFCNNYYVDDVITRANSLTYVMPDLYNGKESAINALGCKMRPNSEIIALKVLEHFGYEHDIKLRSKYYYRGERADIEFFI